MKVITIRFKEQRPTNESSYSYYTDLELEAGDFVVVEARNSYGLGIVNQTVGLSQSALDKAKGWVVQKVDIAAHKAKAEKRELVKELYNQLEQRRKAIEMRQVYELLADTDPELKALLNQLKAIDPNNQVLLK